MISHFIRLFAFTFLFLFSTQICQAQRTFGVNWDIPEDSRQALKELRQMRSMGISFLELQEQPDPRVWKEINSLQFKVYGSLDIRFPLPNTFAEPDSLFIRSIEQMASAYLAQPSVQALGLFKYGPVHKTEFRSAVTPYIEQINATGPEIYFVSSRELTERDIAADFFIYDVQLSPDDLSSLTVPDNSFIGAYQYAPLDIMQDNLSPLRALLESTSTAPDKPIFIRSEWLYHILDKYPSFETTLRSLSTNPEAVFPVPNEETPENQPSVLPILLLIGAWGIIAVLYHISPIYRKSLFRYFVAHKFFMKDIFSRQIRSPMPAIAIILLNAVLLAGSAYAAFSEGLTPLGQTGFFYYFPMTPAGPGPLSFFMLVLITSLLLPLVSILWLFFSHSSIRSLTQIIILYAWPLQLNFITATAAITLYSADASPFWIATCTAIAFIIMILCFVLASLDAARYKRGSATVYLALTSGIYLTLLGALTIWGLSDSFWREVIDLLLNLK